MAINLNPGADATLVNAAYKAAVSTTPGDYSRTLERAADSYEKTMQAQSQTLGSIAKLGASIGADMIESANEFSAQVAKGGGLDSEGAAFAVEELYANKDAQKKLRGINFLQSRETRQKRQELKIQQRELFADIDNAAESVRVGAEAVAAGTFKVLPGNEVDADIVNAIIKSNLKNKVTKEGNMARLSRDEKTGELMYTMYRADGSPSDRGNGEPVTMTVKQFTKSIATNMDDKGVMKGKLNVLNDGSAKSGNSSLNGVYDPEMKQMHLNQLDDIVKTDTDLQRAFGEKFGYSNSSFLEDIQKPSTLSLELYSTLLETTGGGKELPLTGIAEGIEDADGSGGISQAELQDADNYGVLSANILAMKDPEVSKALFKEYTIDKFESAHKYGYGKKPPVAGKTDGNKTETNPYGFPGKEIRIGPTQGGGSNAYQNRMDIPTATTLLGKIEKGTGFPFGQNNYNYLFDEKTGEGGWHEFKPGQNVKTPTETSLVGSAQDLESSIFRTNLPQFQGLETTVDNSKSLSSSGTVVEEESSGLNPFGVGEIPQEFIKAVGEDDDNVIAYVKGLNIPNLRIGKSGNLDTIIIGLGEYPNIKSKTFTVDPNIASDAGRAAKIWNWMQNNYSEPLTAADYAAGKTN